MRIGVVSDFHAEFHRDCGETLAKEIPECDVLVLAGDIIVGRPKYLKALDFLRARAKHVVYVTGNHEYYDCAPHEVHRLLKEYCEAYPEFHWLNRDTVTIEGQRFVGASLWFKKNMEADRNREWLNDFALIKGFSQWYPEQATKDEAFLRQTVQKDDIVVTHHLPSYDSVPHRFQISPFNCYFVNNVEDLVQKEQPKVWIHGHTHDSCDYKIGETRVVCNPFGYVGEALNRKFDAGFAV